MSAFQYAKTTDPDVLAAALDAIREHDEFRAEASALGRKYTGEDGRVLIRGDAFSGSSIAGIRPTDQELPGQWKKADRDGLRTPYQSNPARDDFRIGTREVHLPGCPVLFWSRPDGDGTCWMSEPTLFEHDGAVYFGIGFIPDASRAELDESHGWTEITASEFSDARDARNAKVAA